MSWGDELSKLRADYPELDIWTIHGYEWLAADRQSESGMMPMLRRRTSTLLREALEARGRGEAVPYELE